MAKFCPHCWHEQENADNKFCSKCGGTMDNTQQAAPAAAPNAYQGTGMVCPNCKSLVPAGQFICPNCGSPVIQENHTAAIVTGYLSATLLSFITSFLPIGLIASIICGVYLYTRDNQDVHKHGLIIIGIAVAIYIFWIIFILWAASLSHHYYNSYNSYYY